MDLLTCVLIIPVIIVILRLHTLWTESDSRP